MIELLDDVRSPMLREANTGPMVRWINADLFTRAHHDVRRSVVFYDETGLFVYATPVLPDEGTLAYLFNQTKVRYRTAITSTRPILSRARRELRLAEIEKNLRRRVRRVS